MKKFIIIAIFLLLSYSIAYYFLYNKPHRNIANETADFTLTANQLFDAFDEDEQVANSLYLDKTVSISGKIITIGTNQNAYSVLSLEAENAMLGGVYCTLKEKGESFKIDENISLKCRCTGFLEEVILVDCFVNK